MNGLRLGACGMKETLPHGGFKLNWCEHAGAQQHGRTTCAIDDGRFNADFASAAIDHINRIAEFCFHVRGCGGADFAEFVGARRGDAMHAELGAFGEQFACNRMSRAAQTNRVLPACAAFGHARVARQNHSEWPRPEGIDQALCKIWHLCGEVQRRLCIHHMHDQRMIRRPAFGCKNFGNGRIIASICAQAIDRLSGEGKQVACCNALRAIRNTPIHCHLFSHDLKQHPAWLADRAAPAFARLQAPHFPRFPGLRQ